MSLSNDASSPEASPVSLPATLSSTTTLSESSPEPLNNADTRSRKQTRSSEPYGVMLDTEGKEFRIPDFTIKQVRDAIPPECFERSALRGFGYVLRDMALIATTFILFNTFVTPERVPSYALRFVLWSVYGFLNGLFGTGLWVLAHECGHQSFSTSKTLNDTVGWVLHSALLVPYFSWKISHGKHHKSTGHMERDMVFVPRTRPEFARHVGATVESLFEHTEDMPLRTLAYVVARQIFGWPIYLFSNDTGHNCHTRQAEGRGRGKRNGFTTGVNHFNPDSPIFDAKDAKLILLSDLGLALTAAALYSIYKSYGAQNLAVWYFLPYVWVNHWLVAITFLQHTDPTLPHYTAATWSFTRGALATIDRDLGFIGRHLFHGITDTHVLHHLVSTIPFYNAERATRAVRPVLGTYYRCDERLHQKAAQQDSITTADKAAKAPINARTGGSTESSGSVASFLWALWYNTRVCQWVEPSEGTVGEEKNILFFRNRRGVGPRPIDVRS